MVKFHNEDFNREKGSRHLSLSIIQKRVTHIDKTLQRVGIVKDTGGGFINNLLPY